MDVYRTPDDRFRDLPGYPFAPRYAEWDVPALVAWSDQDPVFTLEHGQAMANALPGAGRLWVVEGAGHMLQEDRGEAIAEKIVEWVAGPGG